MTQDLTIPNPYLAIPIEECGEPLVPIPPALFRFYDPHPYVALGAPYNGVSPWMLRRGIVESLSRVQKELSRQRQGWTLKFYDAYRPDAVQAFMVDSEFKRLVKEARLNEADLPPHERNRFMSKVLKFWVEPRDDPNRPTPHSTGGAMDITLADHAGNDVEMGCLIDETSERAHPDFFANATDSQGKEAHINRVFLNNLMLSEGFRRDGDEWWHFSKGDRYWAKKERDAGNTKAVAIYGRAVAQSPTSG